VGLLSEAHALTQRAPHCPLTDAYSVYAYGTELLGKDKKDNCELEQSFVPLVERRPVHDYRGNFHCLLLLLNCQYVAKTATLVLGDLSL
jgi:hypothetical protein